MAHKHYYLNFTWEPLVARLRIPAISHLIHNHVHRPGMIRASIQSLKFFARCSPALQGRWGDSSWHSLGMAPTSLLETELYHCGGIVGLEAHERKAAFSPLCAVLCHLGSRVE